MPIISLWRHEEDRIGLEDAGEQFVPPVLHVPTDREIDATAVDIGHDMLLDYEDRRRQELRGAEPAQWRRYLDRTRINAETQGRLSATGEDAIVRGFADQAVVHLGYDLPRDSAGYIALCERINAARMAALQVASERAQGFIEAEADITLVRRVRQREKETAQPGETILDLCDKWGAEQLAKGQKRKDGVVQDRKAIARFAAFVGDNRAIDSITRLEIAEYRDCMRSLPPKWMSKRELRDLDMRTAAVKARELKLSNSAFTNVNKHLSTISPLFKWLRKQPRWSHLTNPVEGLFFDDVKGKNPRPSFSTSTLNKILGSPLFTGFQADGDEHQSGNMQADDWRKWVPLAAMYTGARLGEIAQLRIEDVATERGVWFFHLIEDEEEGLRTKSRKSRAMPVHPHLAQMGFLAFRARQLELANNDQTAALFPGLKPNVRDQISGDVSRWWRDYLGAIGVKDGPDGQGSHSFRHTLADRLRSEAELLDTQIAIIMGHSSKTTTAGYGELSQGTVSMLKGWMESVRFDGVALDHLTLNQSR